MISINLSLPEHGWMVLALSQNSEVLLEIIFSDVGPNSILDMRNMSERLMIGNSSEVLEFYLEPSIGTLNLKPELDQLKVDYSINAKFVSSYSFNKIDFLIQLTAELDKVSPYCVHPHWTQLI